MIAILILYSSLATASFQIQAHADLPSSYDCEVTVMAADLTDGSAQFNYVALAQGATTHGGKENSFEAQKHKVVTISDSKWMGITWFHNGSMTAQAVSVRSEENQKAQVLIVYNPADPSEQASLTCTAKVNTNGGQ